MNKHFSDQSTIVPILFDLTPSIVKTRLKCLAFLGLRKAVNCSTVVIRKNQNLMIVCQNMNGNIFDHNASS
jgi:hypothetical protein